MSCKFGFELKLGFKGGEFIDGYFILLLFCEIFGWELLGNWSCL